MIFRKGARPDFESRGATNSKSRCPSCGRKYGNAEKDQLEQRVAELESALTDIAKQRTTNETLQAGEELGDFEFGYNECVRVARKALAGETDET